MTHTSDNATQTVDGGNWFDAELSDHAPACGSTRERLENLIARGAVSTVFQPIVSLETGQIAAFEALTRPAEGSGFADVSELFVAAERTGMLWALERLTRTVALKAAAEWSGDVLLFLNNSPQVFADGRFASEIVRQVRGTPGLNPSRVVLEITERSEQQHFPGLEEQVRLLKREGFDSAIDDVGSGASGLVRIMSLRPRWLKLDRELVREVHLDRVKQNLLRFFVHFARPSDVRMIAEGIETRDELATLIDLGITYAQGYYLARPGTREQTLSTELQEWVRDRFKAGQSGRIDDPSRMSIAKFVRHVEVVQASTPSTTVAAMLLADRTMPGVIIIDDGRLVGWCDRDRAMQAGRDSRFQSSIGFAAMHSVTTHAHTTVSDALKLASARDDHAAALPLIVTEKGRPPGVVTIGDLLHAASESTRHTQLRTSPVTGLPGRVQADEHLRVLLEERKDKAVAGRITPDFDAALLDIRGFASYNATFGYDLGDELLRRVTALVEKTILRGESLAYGAHLGDDRFLVTAPAGTLAGRLATLMASFDASEGARTDDPHLAGSTSRPVLRAMVVEHAQAHASTPQALYRLFEKVRLTESAVPRRGTSSSLRIVPETWGVRDGTTDVE